MAVVVEVSEAENAVGRPARPVGDEGPANGDVKGRATENAGVEEEGGSRGLTRGVKPLKEAWAEGLLGRMGWKASRGRTGPARASADWLVAWRAGRADWPAACTAGEDVFACEVRTEAWTTKGHEMIFSLKTFIMT